MIGGDARGIELKECQRQRFSLVISELKHVGLQTFVTDDFAAQQRAAGFKRRPGYFLQRLVRRVRDQAEQHREEQCGPFHGSSPLLFYAPPGEF